jgi:hypothetical protein
MWIHSLPGFKALRGGAGQFPSSSYTNSHQIRLIICGAVSSRKRVSRNRDLSGNQVLRGSSTRSRFWVPRVYSPKSRLLLNFEVGRKTDVTKEEQIRIVASAVIRRVLLEMGRPHSHGVMSAVDAAYPFGKRRGRPYRIWRDEARRALSEQSGGRGAAA